MARIGVLYDKDIKERVFGVFATNDSTGGYVLTLTASPTTITVGQSSTITATLTYNGNVVQGENVTFKIGSTTVSTGTTDANGKATYTYQSTVVGTIYITASSNNVRGVVDIAIKNYQLTLTTNKSIIGKTDTATITALLTDNGSSVSNETLSYVIKHGSTTISSGSKNTDSNGKATISYTGTGVGDVQVIVSYGSLLQETYKIIDGVYVDIATTGKSNNKWYHYYGTGSTSVQSDGTLIDGTNGIEIYYAYVDMASAQTLTDARDFQYPYRVEFDLIELTGTCFLSTSDEQQTNQTLTGTGHITAWNDGTALYIQVDDSTPVKTNIVKNNKVTIGFRANQGAKLKYKNFVIYPI